MYARKIAGGIMDWDGSHTTVRFHSGRTDSDFGHNDYRNISGLGLYHWHHVLPPHLHIGGKCPYLRYEPPCKFSLDEDCNISQSATPLLVYQSANHPGVNGNTTEVARDMGCGTYSLSRIVSLGGGGGITEEQMTACAAQNDSVLFDSFIKLVKSCSMGEMQTVALDMVEHFKNGNGSDYENDILTKNVRNHSSTKKYIDNAKSIIKKYILQTNGDITGIKEGVAEYFEQLSRPKFNGLLDTIGGLQITINDTWGMYIELKDFVYCKESNQFKGNLDFVIYDHFGLDQDDVNKFGEKHDGFGAWFCLQYFEGFNKKYKPFIDYVKFTVSITE